MMNRRLFCLFVLIVIILVDCRAKVVYDNVNDDIHALISQKNTKYVLRYFHEFKDSLYIPRGCELRFNGGSLRGPIIFNKTKLSGSVNLFGSTISGSVSNNMFNASWLCYRNGINDDASLINQIISVCHTVYFPKGVYNLISKYHPADVNGENYIKAIHSHIGINKNEVTLRGEDGTIFLTEQPLGVITVYSRPYDIEDNVKNVKIEKISFKVKNNGVDFHEPIYVIEIIGVNGLTIDRCYFDDFWGDAICLSHYSDTPKTGERTRNQNVRILNNIIIGGNHHNNRNGISVINGKNVLIKGNTIKNTSRKDMPGGIDVEPNNSAYTIENIRIENNILESIQGSVGAIAIVSYSDGPAHNISIIGNRINNSRTGIHVYIKTNNTTDNFVIKNNTISDVARPIVFTGNGKSKDWIISGNTFERPCLQEIPGDIRVDNLVVKNNKKKE